MQSIGWAYTFYLFGQPGPKPTISTPTRTWGEAISGQWQPMSQLNSTGNWVSRFNSAVQRGGINKSYQKLSLDFPQLLDSMTFQVQLSELDHGLLK